MKQNLSKVEAIAFDFDGVFTNNKVIINEKGEESVICTRADGLGLSKLEKIGVPAIVISTEKNQVVSERCKKLGISCIQGVENKKNEIQTWAKSTEANIENVAFVGNDINDLHAMEVVGYPLCPSDANSLIKSVAIDQTHAKGGEGVVREICDKIDQDKRGQGQEIQISPTPFSMGERVWGEEIALALAPGKVMMKSLLIKKGFKGGLQYHRKRHEMGYIVSGRMIVRTVVNGKIETSIMKPGDHYYFPPYTVHQEEALEETLIIECSNTWSNDRVRVEHIYGEPDGDIGLNSTSIGEEIQL